MTRLLVLTALFFAALTLALACSDDASTTGDGDAPDGDRSETDDDGDRLPDGDLPSDGDGLEQPPEWWRDLPVSDWSLYASSIESTSGKLFVDLANNASRLLAEKPCESDSAARCGQFSGTIAELDVNVASDEWPYPYNQVHLVIENAEKSETLEFQINLYLNPPDSMYLDLTIGDEVDLYFATQDYPPGETNGGKISDHAHWLRIVKSDGLALEIMHSFDGMDLKLPDSPQPFELSEGQAHMRYSEDLEDDCVYRWATLLDIANHDSMYGGEARIITQNGHDYLFFAGGQGHSRRIESRCPDKPAGDPEDTVDGDMPDQWPLDFFNYAIFRIDPMWSPDDPPCETHCDCMRAGENRCSYTYCYCLAGKCVGPAPYPCCESGGCFSSSIYSAPSCVHEDNTWGICE